MAEQLEYFRYCEKPPCGFPDLEIVYIVRGYAIYNSMTAYSLRVYATGKRGTSVHQFVVALRFHLFNL